MESETDGGGCRAGSRERAERVGIRYERRESTTVEGLSGVERGEGTSGTGRRLNGDGWVGGMGGGGVGW